MSVCSYCGGVDHLSMWCFKKPKTKIKRTPLKKTGKKWNKWTAFRKKYLKNHPPNHEGYYQCYLCFRWIESKDITLDHVIPRSARPDLVFDENNIRLCCGQCNSEKGSKKL